MIVDEDVFVGGGEMSALMRAFEWSCTPLGPPESWPRSLRTALSLCLASRFPMLIWWGPELMMLYNDAYRPILGTTKHPAALGQRGRECWPEIWHIIGPMLGRVLASGEATWSDDQLLCLDRNGYSEECYFTFSYSPIRDEAGVGGVFTAVTETTARVLSERRLRTLRDLADRTARAKTAESACAAAIDALAGSTADLPFALLYLLDEAGTHARLAGATGLKPAAAASPAAVSLVETAPAASGWPLGQVAAGGAAVLVDDLADRFGAEVWAALPQQPRAALVLRVSQPGQGRPAGLLVAGISPLRALDDDYRGFLDLVAGHIATAIANARAYEAERRRAEALAELDRAKTAFFSNVSHEFRTPLTLMLGPLEDLMAEVGARARPHERERLEIMHRNGLRLLNLVNTLLDFSRIEAGRVQVHYEPTDLARLTVELASVFRSAVEQAGLRLLVDCRPLPEPVYVDREMWEKIVLNLLSNAFKYTFEGEIAVLLRPVDGRVELSIRDTGIGIAPEDLPRLFERFHRVRGARARTYEGTGIGLALVQELARLHGGAVRATSAVGAGSTFTVTIPLGQAHLPDDRAAGDVGVGSNGSRARPYAAEALLWLPRAAGTGEPAADLQPSGPLILLVDDNADMRDYLGRLLSQHWAVRMVGDGQAALAAAREQTPDLVLADVMMPGLDGFQLLRALRADERTCAAPVLLLSARAGEEAAVEGLDAGADDYLIKPFSARELLARVRTHLALAQLRRESAARETRARQAAERAADRSARLQAVTAALVDIRAPAQVAAVVVEQGVAAMGASAGGLALLDADLGELDLIHQVGYPPGQQSEWLRFPLAAPIPLAEAARTGIPIWLETRAERAARYPDLAGADAGAWAALPLLIGGRAIGALGLRFAGPRSFDEAERAFLSALAQQGAQAIDRARLDAAERRVQDELAQAQRRATFLADAGALLASSLDEQTTLKRLARLCVPFLADICAVDLVLDDGAIRRVAVAHVDPAKERVLHLLSPPTLPLPPPVEQLQQALAAGKSTFVPVLDETRLIEQAGDDDQRALLLALGAYRSPIVVPLTARGRLIGALSFATSDPARRYGPADLALVEELARRAAVALDNAHLYHEARELARDERRHASSLRMLTEAARRIHTTLALDETLRMITDQARAIIGAHQAVTSLVDGERWEQAISTLSLSNKYAAWRSYRATASGQGIYTIVCRENRAMRLTQAELEAHPAWRGFSAEAGRHPPLRGWLAAPLIGRERESIGLIQLSDKYEGEFTAEDEAILVQLAQLAAVAVENARLYRQIQAAVRARDEVISVVSHDLKNPLGVIKGYAQQLQRRARRTGMLDLARVDDYASKIDDAATRMMDLLNDVLDLARLQGGQQLELERQPTDLVALARQVATGQQQTTDRHRILVQAPVAELVGLWDAARLERALANLVSNAIKYSPHGGEVCLAIEQERRDDGAWAVLHVQDYGIGIPEADLPHVFDRFHRGANVFGQISGTGLGLASARQIIEQHRGMIGVASAEGRGARFTLRLPLVTGEVADDSRSTPPIS